MIRRHYAKTAYVLLFLLVMCLVAMSGCTVDRIKTASVNEPIALIAERHDRYVAADESLSQADKSGFLNATITLRTLLATSGEDVQSGILALSFTPVAGRHDLYVSNDIALTPVEKRIFLRSTELVRKVISEATPSETR